MAWQCNNLILNNILVTSHVMFVLHIYILPRVRFRLPSCHEERAT